MDKGVGRQNVPIRTWPVALFPLAPMQPRLGQLHGATRIITSAHSDHALRAEVHAGSLARSAGVIDDNAADAPCVVHVAWPMDDRSSADVIDDDLSVRTRAHEPADQEIMMAAPPRVILGLYSSVYGARDIRDRYAGDVRLRSG